MADHSSPRETHIATPREVPVALATGQVGASQPDGTVALGPLAPLGRRLSLPRPRVALGPLPGQLALALMIAASFTVVMFSSARESTLVPRSSTAFPHWMSGPLHGLFGGLTNNTKTLDLGFTIVLLAMLVAYGVVLASVRTLSMRTLWICLVVLLAIMLMGPPLQLTDVFNYLGYARLGGLHHLNPYTHVIGAINYDPVNRLATWHNLTSPYGELFTALSYPLSWLPLAVAYWILKVVTVLAALGFVWVVTFCARRVGRDPRFALAFVALNPVFIIYAVGGFHNDFLMLLPSMGAIAFVLCKRDRAAGAVLMLAVAVKFTAILLLPFLLVATRADRRWLRVLTGAVAAAIPLAAGSIALFGFSLPNLQDQSTLLTDFSIPQVVGLALGIGGGTPGLLQIAKILVVLSVAYLVWRRRDWLSAAGWATLALIASLAWLMPWYVIWLLPLAALGTSIRLRRAAIVLTLFLILTFVPELWLYMARHDINPLSGSAGQASLTLQHKLEQGP
jgi:hypothetical protein